MNFSLKSLLVGVATIAIGLACYRYGYQSGSQKLPRNWEHGKVNRYGNLPYTQGAIDAEGRMQEEAVKYGSATWTGNQQQYFEWNGLNQKFPRVRWQENHWEFGTCK